MRLWSLLLEDRGRRFQFDRGKKDGVITHMDKTDERMKRKENRKRQSVERRVMSGRVRKTDREKGGKSVSRGQKGRVEGVVKDGVVQ